MTRRSVACGLVLGVLLAGCGRYGPPERALDPGLAPPAAAPAAPDPADPPTEEGTDGAPCVDCGTKPGELP